MDVTSNVGVIQEGLGMITVINGDARHLPLPDESVHLAVTSPSSMINVIHDIEGKTDTNMISIINDDADKTTENFKEMLFSKEKLYDDYIIKQMTQAAVGLKYGVSRSVVSRRMKKWEITSRPAGSTKDLKGMYFGRWKVIEKTGGSKNGFVLWKCRCQCGTKRIIPSGKLVNNETKSCGCLARELSTKHGKSQTSIYRIHYHIIDRCYNPKDKAYHYYGGRGITVCDRWLGKDGFVNFLKDMGDRPKGRSLDRIDNNGNYEPSNCRWATKKEQARNTRRNRLLSLNGETRCIGEWAEILNTKYLIIFKRKTRGWSDKEALTLPRGQHRQKGGK